MVYPPPPVPYIKAKGELIMDFISKGTATSQLSSAPGNGRKFRKVFRGKKRRELRRRSDRMDRTDEFSDGRQYLDPEPEDWGWRNGSK
jgi:hypothetical protein